MNAYGLCIVDHFLGHRLAEKILQEVLALHLSGKFQDGAVASQKPAGSQAIRGDKILWVEGSEPGCENIGSLLKRMDKLIMFADGKLGHYKIRGRHKVSSEIQGRRLSAKFSLAAPEFLSSTALLLRGFYSLPPLAPLGLNSSPSFNSGKHIDRDAGNVDSRLEAERRSEWPKTQGDSLQGKRTPRVKSEILPVISGGV